MDEQNNQLEYFEEQKTPFKALKVRFQLPYLSECSEEGVISSEPEDDNCFCKICRKGFPSIKALTGHMRVHTQIEGDQKNEDDEDYEEDDDDFSRNNRYLKLQKLQNNLLKSSKHPRCPVCQKKFPSDKSLFGHMRCHPDRDWRGIQPPARLKNSYFLSGVRVSESMEQKMDYETDSASSGAEAEDLVQSLPNWRVTGKRGRKAMVRDQRPSCASFESRKQKTPGAAAYDLINTSFESKEQNKIPGVTYDLMSLASSLNTDRSAEPKIERKRHEESEGGTRVFLTKKTKIEGKGNEPIDPKSVWTYSVVPEENCRYRKPVDVGLNLITNKSLFSHSDTTQDKYRCKTCNKTFPTHQALGRHRSSHYKERNSVQDELTLGGVYPNQFTGRSELCGSGSKVMNTHTCSTCKKAFPTGQALGGHKRCHWQGQIGTPMSSVGLEDDEGSKAGHNTSHWTGQVGAPMRSVAFENAKPSMAVHHRFQWTGQIGAPMSSVALEEEDPSKAVMEDEEPVTAAVEEEDQSGSASSKDEEPDKAGTGCKFLGFDLNEPAEMEYDEGINQRVDYPCTAYAQAT